MNSNKIFIIPGSRKREKEIKLRGISHERVCVTSAIDRNENIVLECACMQIHSVDLKRAYNGK